MKATYLKRAVKDPAEQESLDLHAFLRDRKEQATIETLGICKPNQFKNAQCQLNELL